jgi:hypothetical protein
MFFVINEYCWLRVQSKAITRPLKNPFDVWRCGLDERQEEEEEDEVDG